MIFSLLWTKSVSLRGTPVTDTVIHTMMYDDHFHRHENPELLAAFGWLYPQKPLPPDQTWVKAATKCTAPSPSSSSSLSSSPSSSSPSSSPIFYQLRHHQCCKKHKLEQLPKFTLLVSIVNNLRPKNFTLESA